MSRDLILRLNDMLRSLEKLKLYTEGITLDEFKRDTKTQDAVIRAIETLGEAAARIPTGVKAKYAEIPWRFLTDLRNLVIHEYFGIDLDIIWLTAKKDAPQLQKALGKILERELPSE